MSEYFSAAATSAAKRKGGLAKYRSYRTGTYFDKISERYNFVDIYELTTFNVPLDFQKIQFYRENIGEPILTGSGGDGHIIALSRSAHYADQGADHVVLPVQLKVRRFKFASSEDLQLWEEESRQEHINFVGAIPAIAPVREILERTKEDGLIHQATSDRDDAMKEAAAVTATRTTDYEENYFPAGPCGHFECPICYGSLILFDKPKIFVLGYPENAPEVITIRVKDAKTKKLKYLYKLAKLSEISMMLSKMMDSADTVNDDSSPSLEDYYENLS